LTSEKESPLYSVIEGNSHWLLNLFLNSKGPILLEVFCCIQGRYPRLNAIKNEDGTFTNRPFEDMDPFLSREEFRNEMIIDIV
jgi:hypothetical protein